MTKVMFGKTTKTDVVLKYKKIKDNIYVYKLKYIVKGNKINTYGLCFEDDLKGLEEKLLIPKRLSLYKVYHKEFLEVLKTTGFIIEAQHEIQLKEFFNRDESLIPIPEDCIILRALTPRIPDTYYSSNPHFFYKYDTMEYPVPRMVHIGCYNARQHIEPLLTENKYDLEECYKILKKRKDIMFGVNSAIKPVIDNFLFEEEFEEIIKETENIRDLKFLEFFWQPETEEWKHYFYQLENYGLDIANKFLIEKILRLKRKGE